MKNTIFLFTVMLCLISCKDDDEYGSALTIQQCNGEILDLADRIDETTIEVAEWAIDLRTYVTTELPGYVIMNIASYSNSSGNKFYRVELDNQGVLLFNESYEFVCGEGDFSSKYDEEIAIEDLPQNIRDYLNTNYPNVGIYKAELEDGEYEIELDNDIELCFDLQGNFIGKC